MWLIPVKPDIQARISLLYQHLPVNFLNASFARHRRRLKQLIRWHSFGLHAAKRHKHQWKEELQDFFFMKYHSSDQSYIYYMRFLPVGAVY